MDRAVEMYLEELRKDMQPLTEEEKNTLHQRLREGDPKAKRQILELHVEMVVPIAQEYEGKGLWILDLIQEGNCGLVKAAETFDWDNDVAEFTAFAEKKIRRAIDLAFKSACIDRRIPMERIKMINEIAETREKLQEELQREPTVQEIAREMGIPLEETMEVIHVPEKNSEEIIELNLEEPEDTEPVSREDMLRRVIENDERIRGREKEVLCYRVGLNGNVPHTMEETAEAFGVTRERIRALENKVIRRIHVGNRSGRLKDFYT